MTEGHDVSRAGAELVDAASGSWLAPSQITSRLVIFVHGFTSHGRYLQPLAQYVAHYGFQTAIFNYDSYLGIDAAAASLRRLLLPLQTPLRSYGFCLVSHSMGGLVSLQFACNTISDNPGLRGLVNLGTPHRGTLNKRVVGMMLDWADQVTLPNPYARSAACRASLQLTRSDAGALIDTLVSECQAKITLPMLSISGGMEFLEVGGIGPIGYAQGLKNKLLQRIIDHQPNDGLVPENSANAVAVLGSQKGRQHLNTYADFPRTNHTHLTRNQQVAQLVAMWLQGV